MKKIIRNVILLILATTASQGKAQTLSICAGTNTVVTAVNSSGLSNPSYSLNPGGILSQSPAFTVTQSSTGLYTYTLYVTGTNSNSAVVTTSNTVTINVFGGVIYSVFSPCGYTLGCGSKSVCSVQILNAQTTPTAGGAVSYTFLAPGSSTVLPTGTLSSISSIALNVPGTWSVAVRDNNNQCTGWAAMNISLNTTPPLINPVTVSVNPLTCYNPTTMVLIIAPNPAVQYSWLPSALQGNSIIVASNSVTPTQSVATTLTLVVTDNNNACQSTTVIPIFQDFYPPNAVISSSSLLPSCQNIIVLTNQSSTGIPFGIFPNSSIVAGILWEGPTPQATTALSPTYAAQTSGIYTMTARDMNNGCTKTATINVILGPPLAAFVHTITGGQAFFNSVSTGTDTNTSYLWNFGDGNTSTLQNPTHIYLNGGAHFVKLKVARATAVPGIFCTDSVIQSVNVSGIPCTANSNFSMFPTSTPHIWDILPAYPWNVVATRWNWGDGTAGTDTLYTSHYYPVTAMYNICLTVTVSCGDTSTSCTSYSVYRTSQETATSLVNVKAPEMITGLSPAQANTQASWNIVPNPNNGEFKVNLDNTKYESVRIVISDLTGRIVYDQFIDPNPSTSVHTGNLQQGMYLVTLEASNLKVTKRMVVHH